MVKVEKGFEVVLTNTPHHKKFGICRIVNVYDQDYIEFHPTQSVDTIEEAIEKLKEIVRDLHGKYVILQYSEQGHCERVIKNIDKLIAREFAVFTTPEDGAKNKVYFWGVVNGFDRNDAYHKLEIKGLWGELSKSIFLYELKGGRLPKNYFPAIPILIPYDKELNIEIKGVNIRPLKGILPEEQKNAGKPKRGDKGTKGKLYEGTKSDVKK